MNFIQNQSGARRYSLRRDGQGLRLAPNFLLSEFASKDGADEVLVHDNLVALLQMIRYRFDKPVVITSGYRTRAHNKAIGGATESRHIYGLAADIKVTGVSARDVQKFADELDVGGLGCYASFTHVDVDGKGRRF